jgi:type I restriction enzyme R subunit
MVRALTFHWHLEVSPRRCSSAQQRGEDLGLNEVDVAFYDALGANDSAVQVLGHDTLRLIVPELVSTVRANTRSTGQ